MQQEQRAEGGQNVPEEDRELQQASPRQREREKTLPRSGPDVLPLTLSIATHDGLCSVFLPRNTRVPVRKTKVFESAKDNQKNFEIKVVQGERRFAKDNKELSMFILEGGRGHQARGGGPCEGRGERALPPPGHAAACAGREGSPGLQGRAGARGAPPEYKLAKLLQASVHPPVHARSGSAPRGPSGLAVQSPIDRLRSGGSATEFNDTASVSSSTRSVFSTRSAPPGASAQSRLESMYREHGRGTSSASAASTPARGAARPPRPRSGSAQRSAPPRGAGAPQGGGRGAGRRPKLSAEAERRARIAQMQQMYGLGAAQDRGGLPAAQRGAARGAAGGPATAAACARVGAAADPGGGALGGTARESGAAGGGGPGRRWGHARPHSMEPHAETRRGVARRVPRGPLRVRAALRGLSCSPPAASSPLQSSDKLICSVQCWRFLLDIDFWKSKIARTEKDSPRLQDDATGATRGATGSCAICAIAMASWARQGVAVVKP
ncbi:unnamed protein product [Prorocentrum cordatum]|uniref:Uncharacterized protein n=1 Tax=Prorocentrum cordatum TaxID=2364126 RepID=A0ABN9X1B1_9DINO|nr:unnamed protein product [Polarella glacialis]